MSQDFKVVSITARTLETLIRLATAHAKLRLADTVDKVDCQEALELLTYAMYNETDEEKNEDKMELDDEEEIPRVKGKKSKKKQDDEDEEEEDKKRERKKRRRTKKMKMEKYKKS